MQEWIVNTIESLGALGIGLLMLIENVFPPLPSEFIMPLAGYLSATGRLGLASAIAAGTAGSLLGTSLWYLLGRSIDRERLDVWIDAHGTWLTITRDDLRKAQGFFENHGRKAVFFGRLLPVVRTLISVPAGYSRMPAAPFLIYTAMGTALWTALLAISGYLLGANFPQIEKYLGVITWLVLGGAALWYIVRVFRLKRAQ